MQLYEEVAESLERLSRRYRLFALSNGNADLSRCGIAHLFDGPYHCNRRGRRQAGCAYFSRACSISPASRRRAVLHIGDDPLADVVGATQAGMQAAWLNRGAREWPAQLPPPPRTISTLAEIF